MLVLRNLLDRKALASLHTTLFSDVRRVRFGDSCEERTIR